MRLKGRPQRRPTLHARTCRAPSRGSPCRTTTPRSRTVRRRRRHVTSSLETRSRGIAMTPAHERHAYAMLVDTNEHRLLDEFPGELGVVAGASVCSTISMASTSHDAVRLDLARAERKSREFPDARTSPAYVRGIPNRAVTRCGRASGFRAWGGHTSPAPRPPRRSPTVSLPLVRGAGASQTRFRRRYAEVLREMEGFRGASFHGSHGVGRAVSRLVSWHR